MNAKIIEPGEETSEELILLSDFVKIGQPEMKAVEEGWKRGLVRGVEKPGGDVWVYGGDSAKLLDTINACLVDYISRYNKDQCHAALDSPVGELGGTTFES